MYLLFLLCNCIYLSEFVRADFGKEGEPASNITCMVNIDADAPESEIDELIRHVDTIAEIHNTLRKGVNVVLQIDGR